jgi:hypothetical protein
MGKRGVVELRFNPFSKARYLGCLRAGMRRGEAARAAGVSTQTIRYQRARDEDFNQQCYEAESDATDHVESCLMRNIENGDTRAAIFWLVNRAPERWKAEKRQAITVSPEPPQETPEELEAFLLKRLALLTEAEATSSARLA